MELKKGKGILAKILGILRDKEACFTERRVVEGSIFPIINSH